MLGLDLIAAHMLGDYILQTDEMAKAKLTDWRVRLWHVITYSWAFVLVGMWHTRDLRQSLLFALAVAVTHFITDSKRWASGEKWPPKPILVDQTIHLITLAVLGRLLM